MKAQVVFEFDTDEQAEQFERWFENRGEDEYHEYCSTHALLIRFFDGGRRYSTGGPEGVRVFKTYPDPLNVVSAPPSSCTLLTGGCLGCDDCRFP